MGIVISVILILIVVISIVVLTSIYTGQTRTIYEQSTQQTLEIDTARCKYDLTKLANITTLPCCEVGGVLRPLRYLPPGTTPIGDVIVSPSPTNFVVACSGFCAQGVDPDDDSACVSGIGQLDYTNCINTIKPVGCSDAALPVATTNATLYYVFSAGNSGCPAIQPCTVY